MKEFFFKENQINDLEKNKSLKAINAKIEHISKAISALNKDERAACSAFAQHYLDLDKERENRINANLASESEILEEQREEYATIVVQMEQWFPFISGLPDQERIDYALAFLDYFYTRKDVQ